MATNKKQTEANKSVAAAAFYAIHGEKREAYGPVTESFENIATVASIGTGKEITVTDVAMIMIALKYCREANKHDRDNLLDLCGYADLKQQLHEAQL